MLYCSSAYELLSFIHFLVISTNALPLKPPPRKADFQAALDTTSLVVIDCFATWCGPCKVIAPKIVEFSKQYENGRFYKLDVDEVPDLAQELGVRAMPTFFFFKNGEKVGEVVGASATQIETKVKEHIQPAKAE